MKSPKPQEAPQRSHRCHCFPLGTAKHVCLCAEQKGQLQSHRSSPSSPSTGSEDGPAIQLPLETQRMGATRSQPLAPKEVQHHSEHPEGIPPTTTTRHGTARRCSIPAQHQHHHFPAVPTLINAVWSTKWLCCLRSTSAGVRCCQLQGLRTARHMLLT